MPKKIGNSDIIGERGVATARKAILDMGFMFYETGGVEAGIDAYIEIRDPETSIVSNHILQAQCKATTRALPKDDGDTFEWTVSEDEINYWRHGTAPVILIVAEPDHNRCYWKSIRDQFSDADKLARRKIVFDKTADILDKDAAIKLAALAQSVAPGTPPLADRGEEELTLNLLRISHVAPTLYWAPTDAPTDRVFGTKLRALDPRAGSEWIVRSKAILSFHDLDQDPWRQLCDTGAMESFGIEEWSESDDPDRRRHFVELLGRALNQMVWPKLRRDKSHGCYYFQKPHRRDKLWYPYKGLQNQTGRNVVNRYSPKNDPTRTSYFRHSAFTPRFHGFGDDWYLEVTPTYIFTRDGREAAKFASDNLKKIKEIEKNAAVHGQFIMWREFLTRAHGGDLLEPEYPFLQFEAMEPFPLLRSVADELWKGSEAPEEAEALTLWEEDQ